MQLDVFNIAIQILLFAVLVAAATTDVLYRKVFNWITYPGIAFGLTLGYCVGDLSSHLQGFAARRRALRPRGAHGRLADPVTGSS